jgi:hypothetical protein
LRAALPFAEANGNSKRAIVKKEQFIESAMTKRLDSRGPESAFEFSKSRSFQKDFVFLVETLPAVMSFLISHVVSDVVNVLFADRSDEVVVLPGEFFTAQPVLVDPMRRFAFDEPHYLLERLIGAERDQTMHVIDVTVDEIEKNFLFPRVFSDVPKNSRPDVVG